MNGTIQKVRDLTENEDYNVKMVIRRYFSGEESYLSLCSTYSLNFQQMAYAADLIKKIQAKK